MEGSKDLLVLGGKYQRFGNPFMEGSKDLLVLDTKDLGTLHGGKFLLWRFGNPFMEGSKDLLVLDTKDLGTLSWREVRIF